MTPLVATGLIRPRPASEAVMFRIQGDTLWVGGWSDDIRIADITRVTCLNASRAAAIVNFLSGSRRPFEPGIKIERRDRPDVVGVVSGASFARASATALYRRLIEAGAALPPLQFVNFVPAARVIDGVGRGF